MSEKNDVLAEFEKEFKKLREDLKLKPTLEELDDAFYLTDFIVKEGYVSKKLSRQISRRIIDCYLNWGQYLHGLIVVNPNSLINITESQAFTEEEKSKINKMIAKIMTLATKNNLAGLKEDKKLEKEFIEESYSFWTNEFESEMIKISEKLGVIWNEKLNSKEKKKEKRDVMYG